MQVPLHHGHHFGSGYEHPTGVRHGYNDLRTTGPLYSFGHGLSYTDFELCWAASRPPILPNGTIQAWIQVSNTGGRDGETVVQLYARDEQATVVRPTRQLPGFQRVTVAAGETRTVELVIPVERLFYTMPDGSWMLDAGAITLTGGLAADDIRCSETVWFPALP